jgi:hypothetical protein
MRKNLNLTRLVVLLALTTVIELIGLPQPVTGPLINMMLILTTFILGHWYGVLIGCVTPVIAVIRGLLPAVLVPMVPFIAVGNALLVLGFTVCRMVMGKLTSPLKQSTPLLSQTIGVIFGAGIKFSWLTLSASILLPMIFGIQFSRPIIAMMALPQFITAVIGGGIALVLSRLFRKNQMLNQNPR